MIFNFILAKRVCDEAELNSNDAHYTIDRPILANTEHLYSTSKTSVRRLRRCPNVVQMVYKCFAFAEYL